MAFYASARCFDQELAEDTRVPRCNAQQRRGSAAGVHAFPLPALQCAQADPERLGELRLSEHQEPPQRRDIACPELARHDAHALLTAERSRLGVLRREGGWGHSAWLRAMPFTVPCL